MTTTLVTTRVLHTSLPAAYAATGSLSHRAEIVPVPATGSFDGSGLPRSGATDLRDDAKGLSPRAAPV